MRPEKIQGYKNIIKEVLGFMKFTTGRKETILELNRQLIKLQFSILEDGSVVMNHANGVAFPINFDPSGEITFDELLFNSCMNTVKEND